MKDITEILILLAMIPVAMSAVVMIVAWWVANRR